MQRLHAEAQVEDEAEAAQHEGHALQVAERARQLVQSELQAEGHQQDRRDADRTDARCPGETNGPTRHL